jgi:hypothetical protein
VIALYYLGRFGQLLGMWILLVDVFTAGPLGPNLSEGERGGI